MSLTPIQEIDVTTANGVHYQVQVRGTAPNVSKYVDKGLTHVPPYFFEIHQPSMMLTLIYRGSAKYPTAIDAFCAAMEFLRGYTNQKQEAIAAVNNPGGCELVQPPYQEICLRSKGIEAPVTVYNKSQKS